MVQGQHVDAGAEAQAPGALRHGGEKDVLRRGQAVDGGRVVLGQVIGVKARGIETLDLEQALAVDPVERQSRDGLDVVEGPEAQGATP